MSAIRPSQKTNYLSYPQQKNGVKISGGELADFAKSEFKQLARRNIRIPVKLFQL